MSINTSALTHTPTPLGRGQMDGQRGGVHGRPQQRLATEGDALRNSRAGPPLARSPGGPRRGAPRPGSATTSGPEATASTAPQEA